MLTQPASHHRRTWAYMSSDSTHLFHVFRNSPMKWLDVYFLRHSFYHRTEHTCILTCLPTDIPRFKFFFTAKLSRPSFFQIKKKSFFIFLKVALRERDSQSLKSYKIYCFPALCSFVALCSRVVPWLSLSLHPSVLPQWHNVTQFDYRRPYTEHC